MTQGNCTNLTTTIIIPVGLPDFYSALRMEPKPLGTEIAPTQPIALILTTLLPVNTLTNTAAIYGLTISLEALPSMSKDCSDYYCYKPH